MTTTPPRQPLPVSDDRDGGSVESGLADGARSERHGTVAEAPPIPVLVSDSNDLPIYLQIAHQITYLIYSRRLEDEAQLPTVRALAEQLHVNPNTVTQAYTELHKAGLIEAVRGRGTFVRPLSIARDTDWAERHELLVAELQRARRRVHALGFSDTDLKAQLLGVVQAADEVCRAVFVSPSAAAEKYARILTDELADLRVSVAPLVYEALLERTAEANTALDEAYYVMTPVSLKAQVEELLALHDTTHRVLGISLEITPDAVARIAELRPERHVCVFTSDRYMPIALNILHTYADVAFASVARVLDSSPRERAAAAFDAADVVVHTFGMARSLDELDLPHDKRLELEFHVSDDALGRLRDLFGHRAAARAGAARTA